MAINLFGFTIGKKDVTKIENENKQSFTLPSEALDDGAVTISQNAYYGTYVDLEGAVRNEIELITRYREMSNHPELESAIDDIVNEAITRSDDGEVLSINLDKLKQPESIKKKIIEEFNYVKKLLNFNNIADDLFKRWYIDGRIYFHILVNSDNPKEGIQELRYVDPRKIRKVREITKETDKKTGANIIKSMAEYYVYNDRGTTTQTYTSGLNQGLKIASDAIINVNSGLMDAKNTFVISHLHKAIKPLNQLRMVEDAVVIYRLSRAPERRIFYIDVGNLPKAKAEQYLQDIMVRYRNKMVYDSQTGEMRDDRKHLSMLEDFWLPRREGGRGTEIDTLPAGQNLGRIEDVDYFKKKLLQSLHVPYSRLEPQGGGLATLGHTTEITRDELKFAKFIDKLRNKFSQIFDIALKVQLSLKGICSQEEWDEFKEFIYYDYRKDNNFTELREAELLRDRIQSLGLLEPYIGKYFSQTWVKKNILKMTEEEITYMNDEMQQDGSVEIYQQNMELELNKDNSGFDNTSNEVDNIDKENPDENIIKNKNKMQNSQLGIREDE